MFGIGQSQWKSAPAEDNFNLSIIFKICHNFILVFDKNAEIIYFSLVIKITYDSLSKSKIQIFHCEKLFKKTFEIRRCGSFIPQYLAFFICVFDDAVYHYTQAL